MAKVLKPVPKRQREAWLYSLHLVASYWIPWSPSENSLSLNSVVIIVHNFSQSLFKGIHCVALGCAALVAGDSKNWGWQEGNQAMASWFFRVDRTASNTAVCHTLGASYRRPRLHLRHTFVPTITSFVAKKRRQNFKNADMQQLALSTVLHVPKVLSAVLN